MPRIKIEKGTIPLPVHVEFAGGNYIIGHIEIDIPEMEMEYDEDDPDLPDIIHSPDCDEYQVPLEPDEAVWI